VIADVLQPGALVGLTDQDLAADAVQDLQVAGVVRPTLIPQMFSMLASRSISSSDRDTPEKAVSNSHTPMSTPAQTLSNHWYRPSSEAGG
jgi:hypothetical protein